jgi:hypothetical protein
MVNESRVVGLSLDCAAQKGLLEGLGFQTLHLEALVQLAQ